ncbi:hypothetical protein DAI22_11g225500 [Oryza sativa Japonica Group]|nr:hypothetical protein DAI22_11g225500 [Oryza sativa Japonica Group]
MSTQGAESWQHRVAPSRPPVHRTTCQHPRRATPEPRQSRFAPNSTKTAAPSPGDTEPRRPASPPSRRRSIPSSRGRTFLRHRLVVLSSVSSREAAEPRLSLSLASSRHRRSRHPSLALPPQIPAVAVVGRASSMSRRRSRSPRVTSCRVAVVSPSHCHRA